MTNHWLDLQHAKVILIEGSNAAENHSMSMKWVMKAKKNGAIIIHVDPRYTRTSKIADIYAQIRPGTDIAFLGAIINYIIEEKKYDKQFIDDHTNAYHLVGDEYGFADGLFAGFNEEKRSYDVTKWGYLLDETGNPVKTDDLYHERSVFSKLKEHYSRYTFDVASSITGIPVDKIKLIADTLVDNRPGTIMYALGMTQHTVGVQNIRGFGILTLLLGNIGKPGSGVNALRGEPNVQGSTDFACLFNYLPGYLKAPTHSVQTIEDHAKGSGWFRTKFVVNLMKSWFGENATAENDYQFALMPKMNGNENYSIYRIFETAVEEQMKMMYVMGQNPMVTSPNLNLVHQGLCNLEMLVTADLFMTETASFWEKPGVDPSTIDTEVIFLPAASFLEKEGTLSNSGRLVQWRYTGIKPVGNSKSDLDMVDLIYKRLRELYKNENTPNAEIFRQLKWDYSEVDKPDQVLREINGYDLNTGELLTGIGAIRDDGTTCSGNWLYAGVYAKGENKSKKRDNVNDPGSLGNYPDFAWAWPGNVKVLYNRASADKNGKPYAGQIPYVWWDEAAGKWAGYDVADVPVQTDGPNTPNGQKPFRMSPDGVGHFIANTYNNMSTTKIGLPHDFNDYPKDGPIPEFYEPVESPTTNILHPEVAINPCLKYPRIAPLQPIGTKEDFPYVLCTSSVAEHWCAGTVTRNIPWLNELVKETYIEMPAVLAERLEVKNGDRVIVNSARGEVEVKAMVTHRLQTLQVNGEEVVVVWMPYNWGYKGLSQAASTNLLTIDAGDPNTWIQETKACLVNVKKK